MELDPPPQKKKSLIVSSAAIIWRTPNFLQLITELKYPDYRHDLEPSDEENARLDRLVEMDLKSLDGNDSY